MSAQRWTRIVEKRFTPSRVVPGGVRSPDEVRQPCILARLADFSSKLMSHTQDKLAIRVQ
jgi:hypothetical protein